MPTLFDTQIMAIESLRDSSADSKNVKELKREFFENTGATDLLKPFEISTTFRTSRSHYRIQWVPVPGKERWYTND